MTLLDRSNAEILMYSYLQYTYLVPYPSLNKSTLVRHLTFSPSDLYTVLSLVLTFYWCGLPFVLSELKFMETKKQNEMTKMTILRYKEGRRHLEKLESHANIFSYLNSWLSRKIFKLSLTNYITFFYSTSLKKEKTKYNTD